MPTAKQILQLLEEEAKPTIIRCRPDKHIEFKDLPSLAQKLLKLLEEKK